MFQDIEGQKVNTVSFGSGGVPLVGISGSFGTWEIWQQPFELLSSQRRVIGYDHYGTGENLEHARELQRTAAHAAPAATCWLAHDTDHIESWAPFSNVPTHFLINVDGVQKWYGQ